MGELAERIRGVLDRGFPGPVVVQGEVSNLSRRNHWYFSLKDEEAVIGCVVWASTTRRIGFDPEDGMAVVATGRIGHYGPQGRTQLYVSELAPAGAGRLEQEFRARCERLRAEGLFDPDLKRALPAFPRRIAVITSAKGAALHDVLDTARRRWPAVAWLLVDVLVQGDAAAGQITRVLRGLGRRHRELGLDAILVTRGGGSLEDLWAFNDVELARAVTRAPVPVIAAIGHESDTTIIELVADARGATPTQAAMLLVPDRAELLQQVDHLEHRLAALLRQLVTSARYRVEAAAGHPLFGPPARWRTPFDGRMDRAAHRLIAAVRRRVDTAAVRVERLASRLGAQPAGVAAPLQRLAVLETRLHRATEEQVRAAERRLAGGRAVLHRVVAARHGRAVTTVEHLERRWQGVDPRRVLHRGFTYTTTDDGTLVRTVADAPGGRVLHTHVPDGEIRSVVTPAGAPGPKPKPTRRRADEPSMDLFEDAE